MFKRAIYIILILASFVVFSVLVALQNIPDANKLTTCVVSTVNKVKLCSDNPDYVSLDNVSEVLVYAIVISEDAAFFGHDGFDWDELKNSLSQNIQKGRFARGGSTITQQLAKNVFLTHEKSILRKIKEAYLAHQIEQLVSKKIILEKYLNVIELGKGIYGVKNAALHYFNKLPSQVNPLEAAFIAYLLPSPVKYSQVFETKTLTTFSEKRIKTILRKLKNFKRITPLEQENALMALSQIFNPITETPPQNYNDDDSETNGDDLHIIDEDAVDDNSLGTEESDEMSEDL